MSLTTGYLDYNNSKAENQGGFNMLIKFDEKYLTISSEITNYAKREEMEKIQQLCGEIVEVIKSVRERRVVKA